MWLCPLVCLLVVGPRKVGTTTASKLSTPLPHLTVAMTATPRFIDSRIYVDDLLAQGSPDLMCQVLQGVGRS